ncbi:MAG: prepilin peptidase [Candidatus Paceibacterota bacterium]
MMLVLAFIFFIFGLIVGSFLNVVIIRFNTKRSLGGRSGCMTCQNKLSWYELIPVFSFLGLGGRCLNCKTKISIQYPLVELAAGFIFAALFLKFQDIFLSNSLVFVFIYAYYAVAFSLLMVIAVYDIRHKIIPDTLALILGILTFAGLFFFNANGFYLHVPLISEFLSGILIAVPFTLFWFISHGAWMGLGDAKLAISLGWLLGLSMSLSGIVLAFWIGAIVGISLIIFSKKHGMKSEIPFAPYLVLGTLLAFLFELHLFGI